MCAFEGKATTHSQFLASDKFRVALRERIYLGHRQIIEICIVRCVAPLFVLTVGPMRMRRPSLVFVCMGDAQSGHRAVEFQCLLLGVKRTLD